MRGDNVFENSSVLIVFGTPPHAWGQCEGCSYRLHYGRYTPTCVGTMYYMVVKYGTTTVHPHMRGDNIFIVMSITIYYGTPPHAWGQYSLELSISTWNTVHPHMRGDNKLALTLS